MKAMGWDYWMYRRQPGWIIREIMKAMAAESLAGQHAAKGRDIA